MQDLDCEENELFALLLAAQSRGENYTSAGVGPLSRANSKLAGRGHPDCLCQDLGED